MRLASPRKLLNVRRAGIETKRRDNIQYSMFVHRLIDQMRCDRDWSFKFEFGRVVSSSSAYFSRHAATYQLLEFAMRCDLLQSALWLGWI